MRSSEVKTAIEEAILASPVDGQVSNRDKFRILRTGLRPMDAAAERSVWVILTVPPAQSGRTLPQDLLQATWDVSVAYNDAPDVDRRVGDDGERISQALENVALQHIDVAHVTVDAMAVIESEGFIVSSYQITAEYRKTAGV